jgi:hypothetical protein
MWLLYIKLLKKITTYVLTKIKQGLKLLLLLHFRSLLLN